MTDLHSEIQSSLNICKFFLQHSQQYQIIIFDRCHLKRIHNNMDHCSSNWGLTNFAFTLFVAAKPVTNTSLRKSAHSPPELCQRLDELCTLFVEDRMHLLQCIMILRRKMHLPLVCKLYFLYLPQRPTSNNFPLKVRDLNHHQLHVSALWNE